MRTSTRLFLIGLLVFFGTGESAVAQSGNGSLKVTSYPSGADVTIDGVYTGKVTPMSESLSIGTHVVEVSVPTSGWNPDTRTVTIVSGNNDLSVTLLPTLTTGPTGATGQTGAPGPAGSQGPIGQVGPAGAQGDPGIAGAQGDPGIAGAQGDPGAEGASGAQGPAGPAGAQGAVGSAGPQGPTGPTGPVGPPGEDGVSIQGPVGPAGSQGPAGTEGPAGPSDVYIGKQNSGPFLLNGAIFGVWTSVAMVTMPPGPYLIQAAATGINPTNVPVDVHCGIFVNRNPFSIAYTFVLKLAPAGSPGHKAVMPLLSAIGASDVRWGAGPGMAELICGNTSAQIWNPTITAMRTGMVTEIDQSLIVNP
jgi:hypothetical protein